MVPADEQPPARTTAAGGRGWGTWHGRGARAARIAGYLGPADETAV